MKKFITILSVCFAFVAISHVSYAADVGKHSGTKTEYSVPSMHVEFIAFENNAVEFNYVAVVYLKSFNVEPVSSVAILVKDVGKETDHGTYLPVTKSNYRSPFLDLSYKWKYSAWYNS